MQNKLTKIFQKAKYEGNSDLTQDIWHTIIKREKRDTKIKFWAFASMGFTSFVGLVPAVKILINDFTQSGFYDYFSLLFSNSEVVFSYWKELGFSLAESLPTMSITLTLSLVFILILSLKNLTKQIINNNPIGKTYGVA
ncbi:MAG: hypothetical protein WC671_00985 [Candidatus Paceibacterota bacterium]|jgi:hypothetical protein